MSYSGVRPVALGCLTWLPTHDLWRRPHTKAGAGLVCMSLTMSHPPPPIWCGQLSAIPYPAAQPLALLYLLPLAGTLFSSAPPLPASYPMPRKKEQEMDPSACGHALPFLKEERMQKSV